MNLNAVILVLLGAITNVESKFVPSPYATIINDNNRGSTAVVPSPYATINDNNRGSTAVAKRKLSKKNMYAVSKDIVKSIEGLYYYLGSCASIYKVIIKCGTFGNPNNIDDRDLCIYEEYKAGTLIAEEEGVEIPADAIALDDGSGLLFVPKDGTHYKDEDGTSYEKEGNDIDRNEVCVLSGTFRHSSTVVVNKGSPSGLLPIPLAKSNGCNKPTSQSCCANADTQNFQFVVKANILDNGDLDISVSSNHGLTYYTDNISTSTEVPEEVKELMYTAQKDGVAEYGRRQLFWPLIVAGIAVVAVGYIVVGFLLVKKWCSDDDDDEGVSLLRYNLLCFLLMKCICCRAFINTT